MKLLILRTWTRNAGWTGVCAALCALLAVALAAGGVWARAEASGTQAEAEAEAVNLTSADIRGSDPAPAVQLPLYGSHLADVEALLRTAAALGLPLDRVTYRDRALPGGALVIRTLDFASDEEYPKIKEFLAAVLEQFPHGYLEELKLDRADLSKPKLHAAIRLALAYRVAGAGTGPQERK